MLAPSHWNLIAQKPAWPSLCVIECIGSWHDTSFAARQAVKVECFAVQGTQQQPQRPQLPPSLAELYPHLMPRPAQQREELPPPAAVSAIQHLPLLPTLVLMRLILHSPASATTLLHMA